MTARSVSDLAAHYCARCDSTEGTNGDRGPEWCNVCWDTRSRSRVVDDLVARLEAAEAEVAALTQERDQWKSTHDAAAADWREEHDRRRAAEAALAGLKADYEVKCRQIEWQDEARRQKMAEVASLEAENADLLNRLETAAGGTERKFKAGDKLPTGETFIGYTGDGSPMWSESVGGGTGQEQQP